MKGTLDIYCAECEEMIRWRKENMIRDDGYYDWRLAASCGCGEIADPEILDVAKAAYRTMVETAIIEEQERAMETILGAELHAAFNDGREVSGR